MIVTLEEIKNFDFHPRDTGREQVRFLCCLTDLCRQKPRDDSHRSLAVNTSNGLFYCHRCGAKGVLKEFWKDKPKTSSRVNKHSKLASRFEVSSTENVKPEPKKTHKHETLEEQLKKFQSAFAESAAERYLVKRGINSEIANSANCGFADSWEHWEKQNDKWILKGCDRRAIFPICGENGELVAFHGRAIDENYFDSPKITKGDKSLGLFLSMTNALDARVVAICEGATDALALATCGIAAVAMTGTTAPIWMFRKLGFKSILIATDADEAGDVAAIKIQSEFENRGAKLFRLRPKTGKDWAELLERDGIEKMRKYLGAFAIDADDELRTNTAWNLYKNSKTDAANFITDLIEDGDCRESLRRKFGNNVG